MSTTKLHRSVVWKNILLFILAGVIITLSFPEAVKSKFKYDYAVGRPWNYELLTAPFSFHILKSPSQLQYEKDSVTRSVLPYYSLNTDTYVKSKNKLTQDFQTRERSLSSEYVKYIMRSLDEVYEAGIITKEDLQLVMSTEEASCYVLNSEKVARKTAGEDLFTIASAYDYILEHTPSNLDKEILKTANINNYLRTNLSFNKSMTDKVLQTRLATISPIVGEIQEGEKIASRGDVVTYEMSQTLDSLKKVYESKTNTASEMLLIRFGQFAITIFILATFLLYLYAFRPEFLAKPKNSLFMLATITLFMLLTQVSVYLEWINVFVIPYAIIAILIRTFFDSRTAFMAFLVTIMLAVLVVPFAIEFVLVQFIAGAVTIVTLRNLSQRSDLIRCTFLVFVSMVGMDFFYLLYRDGNLEGIAPMNALYFAINFILLMFSYVLVYIIEKLFGYISNVSLVELSNIYGSPLLRQMSEVAPGTAQHSQQVAILASEAAAKIGANVQLVRTGALYHDIGKMKNPTYFTENQGGVNPHDKLSYDESARMIISHVTDGVEMAEKAKLPSVVIDFIRTHHGLGRTRYFYNMYKNENPDQPIDESVFRYPGPNPFSKETGILMLADAVEASSRSLTELTEQKISQHIDKIVDGLVDEGLLRNTPLTFRDIETIKHIFHEKLKTMYHSRIAYPELKNRDSGSEPESEGGATT